MKSGRTNKNYKDRLFKFIFGNPDNKEWTLSLYNAVNGSNYKNSDDIKYNTIDNAIYMNMKNDVSFIVENMVHLYEQQSTYCPNMPLRFLMYLAKLYEGYVQVENLYLYGKTLQRIPKPKCICFYNGADKKEDRTILRLSEMYFKNDAHPEDTDGIVELEVIMLNVNFDHNKKLLEECKPLYEYSFLVDRIKSHVVDFKRKGVRYTLEDAINKAIDDLPEDFKILNFILSNRAEVCDMCLFEFDEEKAMQAERAEGREEGRAEGRAEGIAEGRAEGIAEGTERTILELVLDGFLDENVAAQKLGITLEKLREKLQRFKEENSLV